MENENQIQYLKTFKSIESVYHWAPVSPSPPLGKKRGKEGEEEHGGRIFYLILFFFFSGGGVNSEMILLFI